MLPVKGLGLALSFVTSPQTQGEVGWAPSVGRSRHIAVYPVGNALEEKGHAPLFFIVGIPHVKLVIII